MYGEGVIGELAAQKWVGKFKNGDFDLNDTPCIRRPAEFDEEHLKLLLKEDSSQTSCELAKNMNCDHKTILNHLHSMGFTEKLRAWVPYELSKINKENHLQIAAQHLARHRATQSHEQLFCTESS